MFLLSKLFPTKVSSYLIDQKRSETIEGTIKHRWRNYHSVKHTLLNLRYTYSENYCPNLKCIVSMEVQSQVHKTEYIAHLILFAYPPNSDRLTTVVYLFDVTPKQMTTSVSTCNCPLIYFRHTITSSTISTYSSLSRVELTLTCLIQCWQSYRIYLRCECNLFGKFNNRNVVVQCIRIVS